MRKKRGFTIPELLIIIVVLGILASIAALSYRASRNESVENAVSADLKLAAGAMEQHRNFNDVYPNDVPNDYTGATNVTIVNVSETGFCLKGESSDDDPIVRYIKSGNSDPSKDSC